MALMRLPATSTSAGNGAVPPPSITCTLRNRVSAMVSSSSLHGELEGKASRPAESLEFVRGPGQHLLHRLATGVARHHAGHQAADIDLHRDLRRRRGAGD